MRAALAIVVILFAAVLAQEPSKPKWPGRFSASVAVRGWSEDGRRDFFRWFYDEKEDKDRIDGLARFQEEEYFAQRIFDHKAGKRYDVFYQPESEICFISAINDTLPKPNFQDIKYLGKAIIDYEPVYTWFEESRDRRFGFQYYDTQADRRPKRLDVSDRRRQRAVEWIFHEFDECNQDPSLFDLPKEILDQCNNV